MKSIKLTSIYEKEKENQEALKGQAKRIKAQLQRICDIINENYPNAIWFHQIYRAYNYFVFLPLEVKLLEDNYKTPYLEVLKLTTGDIRLAYLNKKISVIDTTEGFYALQDEGKLIATLHDLDYLL